MNRLLEGIKLNKISQTEKDTFCLMSLLGGILKKKQNKKLVNIMKQKQTQKLRERTSGY